MTQERKDVDNWSISIAPALSGPCSDHPFRELGKGTPLGFVDSFCRCSSANLLGVLSVGWNGLSWVSFGVDTDLNGISPVNARLPTNPSLKNRLFKWKWCGRGPLRVRSRFRGWEREPFTLWGNNWTFPHWLSSDELHGPSRRWRSVLSVQSAGFTKFMLPPMHHHFGQHKCSSSVLAEEPSAENREITWLSFFSCRKHEIVEVTESRFWIHHKVTALHRKLKGCEQSYFYSKSAVFT